VKILAIRGCNLASLAGEFEVELATGPLAHSGVFAITGNTGAGKSTLLDAMCLALFDRVPRMALRSAVYVSAVDDDISEIGDADVCGLLRRGSGRGWAEVDFLSDDKQRYRARWSVHRSHNKAYGALQPQEMSLVALADGRVLGGKKTETLLAIRERLGLSFDQFKRSALLAQGDFAAFLRADGKERSDLLERMTGTQIYSSISKLSHQQAAEHKRQVEEWNASIKTIECLTDEQRADLLTRLEQESNHVTHHAQTLVRGEQDLQWRRAHAAAASQLVAAETQHLVARRQREAIEPDHLRWQRWMALSPARLIWNRAKAMEQEARNLHIRNVAAEQQVQQLSARVANHQRTRKQIETAEDSLRSLVGSLREPQASASDDEDSVELQLQSAARLKEQLSREQGLAALSESWAVQGPLLERMLSAFRQHHAVDEEVALQAEAIALLQTQLDQQRMSQQAAQQSLAKAVHLAESYDRKRKLQPDAGRRAEDVARQRLADVERLTATLQAALDVHADTNENRQQQSVLSEKLAQAAQDQALHDATLSIVSAAREESQRSLAKMLEAAALSHHRAALVDGESCPVCGSLEHPWSDGAVIDQMLSGQQRRVNELAAQQTAEQNQLREIVTRKHVATTRLQDAEDKQRMLDERTQQLQQAWQSQHVDLGVLQLISSPTDPGAEQWLQGQRKSAQDALTTARAEREKADKAAQAATEALGAVQTERHLVAEIEAAMQRQSVELASRTARKEGDSQRLQQLAVEMAALWQDSQHGKSWQMESPRGSQLPTIKELAAAQQLNAGRVERWTTLVSSAHRLCASLRALAVEQSQRMTVDQQHLAALQAVLHADQKRHDNFMVTLRSDDNEIHEMLAATGTSKVDAEQIFSVSVEAMDHLATSVQQLDRAVLTAEQLVAERQRVSQIHQQTRVVDDNIATLTDAELATECARILTLHGEAETNAAELRRQIHIDDDRQQRQQHLLAQIAAAEFAAGDILALAEVIGSHDGKTFRAFAQGLTLDSLLEQANDHLRALAPRYRLARVPKHDLELQIVDHDMADEIRPVTSLSGGETFLFSLALALGLSSLASQSVRVQSLFIDEGFGTLDSATLDAALAVLDSLQSTGRQVGIISHVPSIAERVGASVHLVSRGAGKSHVIVS
jgi:DNA repair protein SbcC/Rad50